MEHESQDIVLRIRLRKLEKEVALLTTMERAQRKHVRIIGILNLVTLILSLIGILL